MIKSQSERRDHELWLHSLRRSAAEDHLSTKRVQLNEQIMGPDSPVNGAREINSNVKVKQLLALIEE